MKVVTMLLLMLAVEALLILKGCAATAEFLDAVEWVESRWTATARGDGGRAVGSFQFWAGAWDDVNRLRCRNGRVFVPFSQATNRVLARAFAVDYFGWLRASLATSLRRDPTDPELYAAWNLGLQGFRRRGFQLSKCPRRTRAAAEQICRIIQRPSSGPKVAMR